MLSVLLALCGAAAEGGDFDPGSFHIGLGAGPAWYAPVGPDIAQPESAEPEFGTAPGFRLEIFRMDFSRWLTVAPFVQVGFGASNADAYCQRPGLAECFKLNSSVFDAGGELRFYPAMIGRVRPLVSGHASLATMAASLTGSGETVITYSDGSTETISQQTYLKTHSGLAVGGGLGARWDAVAWEDAYATHMVPITLQAVWSHRLWSQLTSDDPRWLEMPFLAGREMRLDHLQLVLTVGISV